MTLFDRRVIDDALWLIDHLEATFTAEESRRFYMRYLMKLVREERFTVLRLLQMTNDKNWGLIADTAARELAAESVGLPWHPLIQAYLLINPQPPQRGRGRNEVDNLLRDTVVATWVAIGRERWPHLSLTRNDATAGPSVCWAISSACGERRNPISEARCADVYGLHADIMPEHVKWLRAHDPDFLDPERVRQRYRTLKKLGTPI